jgi:hypothetical protein
MKSLIRKKETKNNEKNDKKLKKPAQCCAKTSDVKAGCHD